MATNFDVSVVDIKNTDEFLSYFMSNRLFKRIAKENRNASIYIILSEINKHISSSLFPNCPIAFYPNIREVTAKTNITCDIGQEKIQKGSTYCTYRPLLENLTDGKRFVLKKTLKAELAYEDFFPTNICEFEDLDSKLTNPFLEEGVIGQFDYYDISKTIGQGLSLLPLHKKKIYVKHF